MELHPYKHCISLLEIFEKSEELFCFEERNPLAIFSCSGAIPLLNSFPLVKWEHDSKKLSLGTNFIIINTLTSKFFNFSGFTKGS
jgi:hypothetical protein